MKIITTLTIVTLTNLTLFGQEFDSLQKARIDEMMKEMQMLQQDLQPKKVDNFSAYFKPELIDTFFTYIRHDNYDKLYENSDDRFIQSKEDLIKYFKAIKSIYGGLKSYEHETYSIKNQMISMNKLAYATYTVEFDYAKANVSTAFNVIDSMKLELQAFQIATHDYAEFMEFEKLTKPTFNFLTSKDYPGLYNSTSKRFQDYTPIAKYVEFTNQIDKVNFKKSKLLKNQIGLVNGQLMYYLIYEISDGDGYLTLTYTETNERFLLEGMNYNPKE